MPIDIVVPAFRFGVGPMDADVPCSSHKKRNAERERLKAYKPGISPKTLESYRVEYESKRETLHHVSFTEYATFIAENRMYILNAELQIIRTKYFGFPLIQHSDHLVEFYTGLPNASQFYYISSMLQRWIFRSYIKWEPDEKHGFLNHTMITLMKLRLNMPDEELAQRFGIEPYMVNMTLRTWLPGMYISIYKTCEELYRVPRTNDDYISKVVDIVEVCFETPEYTRRHRDNKNEARKAVLCIRNDGFVNYASSVVSDNRPDAETIKRSRFGDICYNMDMVAAHQEHLTAVAAMGIACRRIPNDAEYNIREAAARIKEFRILMGIPLEYRSFHEYIFPVCAALSNFYLMNENDEEDPHFPDPDDFEP